MVVSEGRDTLPMRHLKGGGVMTPMVNMDGQDRVAQAAPAPTPTMTAERAAVPAAQEPTYAERQGMAMGWVAITLGIFVLLAGLALWAAAVFNAGFAGWLIA